MFPSVQQNTTIFFFKINTFLNMELIYMVHEYHYILTNNWLLKKIIISYSREQFVANIVHSLYFKTCSCRAQRSNYLQQDSDPSEVIQGQCWTKTWRSNMKSVSSIWKVMSHKLLTGFSNLWLDQSMNLSGRGGLLYRKD